MNKPLLNTIFQCIFLLILSASTVNAQKPFIYVSNSGSDNISVINSDNEDIITTIPVGNRPIESVTYGNRVYTANYGENLVSVIDSTTNSVINNIVLTSNPFMLTLNHTGKLLYVSYNGSNNNHTVSVISTDTFKVIKTLTGFAHPQGMILNKNDTKLYVISTNCCNNINGYVSILDANTYNLISTIELKIIPTSIVLHPDQTKAYISNNGGSTLGNTVGVIDLTTNKVTDYVLVGLNPYGIAINSIGTRVYVANSFYWAGGDRKSVQGTVSVIDTSSNTVIDTIEVGYVPNYLAISPDDSRIYVANQLSDTVSVIDTSSNTVINTIPVGIAPWGIAISNSTTGSSLNVPLFKQNNPIWEASEYDHASEQFTWCGKTMASCGCATTSIAMILNYYGVNNPSNGEETTPETVNDYFKLDKKSAVCGFDNTNNKPIFGWRSRGYSCADVVWKAAAQYSKDAFKANKAVTKIDLLNGGPISYNSTTLTDDINLGNPDILRNVDKTHYFVAKGYEGNTFLINDPFHNITRLDNPEYKNSASQMIRYHKVGSDFSSIIIPVIAPDQILITDPNGNRTGYDPTTSQTIQEIPDSNYYFQPALIDSTGQNDAPPAGTGQYWASIGTPQAGTYKIEIIPSGVDGYSFGVYSYSKESDLTLNNLYGRAIPGNFPTYLFSYDPISVNSYSAHVNIDIKPGSSQNPINTKSKGKIPVAILSSGVFNAVSEIDTSTLTFGHNGKEKSLAFCNQEDVNHDGLTDLLCLFNTQKTKFQTGDTQGKLNGKTKSDMQFTGKDNVWIIH